MFTLQGQTKPVLGVAFSHDGTRLAGASADKTVRIWDSGNRQDALTLIGPSSYCVAFSPDGSRLVSAGGVDDQAAYLGQVKVWEAKTGKEIRTLERPISGVATLPFSNVPINDATVYDVAFSPDGTRLSGVLPEGTVVVWDTRTWQVTRTLVPPERNIHDWWTDLQGSVSWSPDGRCLASVFHVAVHIWNPETGQEIQALKDDRFLGAHVAFSPDGTRLAGAGGGRVTVCDTQTWKVTLTLESHDGQRDLGRLSWSPDGTRLAGASRDGTVKVWDATSGQELLSLQGHTGPVLGVSWSPDGTRLASAAADKMLKVWDATSGQEVLTLNGGTDYVSAVSWSPDGTRLVSGHIRYDAQTKPLSGKVKVWDATPDRVDGARR
jgi:WD40 repeat protein